MSDKPFVFISCGQVTDVERQLGREIAELVSLLTPFDPYFADFVTSLDGLTSNIFDKLQRAAGYIFVFHNRGTVHFSDHDIIRASLWIEQELAIASFVRQVTGKESHLAAYVENGVQREGVRQALILNPIDFSTSSEVLAHLKDVLPRWVARPVPSQGLGPLPPSLSTEWFATHAARAVKGLNDGGFSDFMEIRCRPVDARLPQASASDLIQFAQRAIVNGSGWPIGVADPPGPQGPKTVRDGVTSEVLRAGKSYDYCCMTHYGDIFVLRNLWETWAHRPQTIVGEARVAQVVEAVLFCVRLLMKMGLAKDAMLRLSVRHAGYVGFMYTRFYSTPAENGITVDANEALDVLEFSPAGLLNEAGRLRSEPFLTLTSDLFRGADFHGVPKEEFFNQCIERRLGLEDR